MGMLSSKSGDSEKLQKVTNDILTDYKVIEDECKNLLGKVKKESKDDCTSNTVTTMVSGLELLNKRMSDFRSKWTERYPTVQPTQRKQSVEYTRSHVSVQVYCQRNDQGVQPIWSGFERRLTEQFAVQKTAVGLTKLVDPSSIGSKLPVLVICIDTSRLGADAEIALHGVNLSAKIALVILHLRGPEALPRESSDAMLQQLNFNLGAIFDMAYLEGSGFYDCTMNTKALNGIVKFINDNN